MPLYYDNNIIGTIQKIYTDKQMNELFAASLFSSKGYMYVINSEGYIILHTKHINCALNRIIIFVMFTNTETLKLFVK